MSPIVYRSHHAPDLACESCDRAFNRGDIVIAMRNKEGLTTVYCRSCLNDVDNAIDQLFRSEDRGVKEVKP